MGVSSRREAETWITSGRIQVNGKVVKELGAKVDPDKDKVLVDGQGVGHSEPVKAYWLLHKPRRVSIVRSNVTDRDTIYQLPRIAKVNFSYALEPVGRLDIASEGLLIMTSDRDLARKVAQASKKKGPDGFRISYNVLLSRKLTSDEIDELKAGGKVEGGFIKVAKIRQLVGAQMGASSGVWYEILAPGAGTKGMRQLLSRSGIKVVRVVATKFGDIELPSDLKPGDYRQLSSGEIAYLKRLAGSAANVS
jgi:23S rRNA pseudouridine2605 synthase